MRAGFTVRVCLTDAAQKFVTPVLFETLTSQPCLIDAFDEASNELVGVVRIHSDSVYESGEYAILLRSDLKGRGLGWTLMQMIIEYARSEGLKAISGDVLSENTVMLAMCRSLGFEVKSDPVEHEICNVRLAL